MPPGIVSEPLFVDDPSELFVLVLPAGPIDPVWFGGPPGPPTSRSCFVGPGEDAPAAVAAPAPELEPLVCAAAGSTSVSAKAAAKIPVRGMSFFLRVCPGTCLSVA